MIRLALPKGRLWQDSTRVLQRLGIPVGLGDRRYAFRHPSEDIDILILKIQDIPQAVTDGLIDFAVASDEWLVERGAQCVAMTPLCWYHVRISVLAPGSAADYVARALDTGDGSFTVATPYPMIARRFEGSMPRIRYRHVTGAVEAYPGRLTDLAIDCLESGETARTNGLVEVRELVRCDVRLVRAVSADTRHPAAQQVIDAVLSTARDRECAFADALVP